MNVFDDKNIGLLNAIDNAVKIAEAMAQTEKVVCSFKPKGHNITEIVENYIDDIFKSIESKTGKSWNLIRDDFNQKIIGDKPQGYQSIEK